MAAPTPTRSRVSLHDLREGRVALVLMGGGAKGAYQVGVWEALWKKGIRRFCVIAGTSVGALNALLIAGKEPEEVKRVWHEVIQGGVLHDANARLRVLSRLFAGYALFLTPVIAAAMLFLLPDKLVAGTPMAYAVSATLLGLSLLLYSTLMLRIASRGFVIPLLKLKMADVKWVAAILLLSGVAAAFFKTPDWLATFRIVFLLALPSYLVVFWMAYGGMRIIKRTLAETPLFSRPVIDITIKKLLEDATFKNCSGPIWATLSKFSSYQNPFAIDWRFKPDGLFVQDLLGGRWRYNDGPELVEWTPFYIDIRAEPDASWVLEASSAIPYAFSPVQRNGDFFVDGGLCDNWPVAPVIQNNPDYVIVVCVNHEPIVGDNDDLAAMKLFVREADPRTLAEVIRANWAKFVFSNPAMEQEVNRIRAEWVIDSARCQGPDNLFGLPAPEKEIGVDPSSIKFLWICPSVKTASSFPIVNTLNGTMNFTQEYADWLAKLGHDDTKRFLEHLKDA